MTHDVRSGPASTGPSPETSQRFGESTLNGSSAIETQTTHLSELLERTKRIESISQYLMTQLSTTSHPATHHHDDQSTEEHFTFRGAGSVGHRLHSPLTDRLSLHASTNGITVEDAFGSPTSAEWLAEPVVAGLISKDHLRKAYDRARPMLRQVLPLPRLILSVDPAAHHPFLQSCLLLYSARQPWKEFQILSAKRYAELQKKVERVLVSLDSVPPHEDIVIALLVLSLLPISTLDSRLRSTVDPFNAVELGIRLAKTIGLDTAYGKILRKVGQHQKLRIMPWDLDLLRKAQVWGCLINRSTRVDLLATVSLSTPMPRTSNILPADIPESHLLTEELLDMAFYSQFLLLTGPVCAALRDLQEAMIPELHLIENIVNSMNALYDRSEDWRSQVSVTHLPSRFYLIGISLLTEMMLCYRLSHYVGAALPSPLAPENRLHLMMELAGSFFLRAEQYMKFVVENTMDLSLLPSFDVVLSILAYATSLQASRVVNSQQAQQPSPAEAADEPMPTSEGSRIRHTFREKLVGIHVNCQRLVFAIDNLQPPDTAWRDIRTSIDDAQTSRGQGEEGFVYTQEDWQMIDWQTLFGIERSTGQQSDEEQVGEVGMPFDWQSMTLESLFGL
ncbi:uncharacterized protein I303_106728 [Kwoniella dejecticola CBS 10117]|uniref:Transcription factor domain-containing protein n=1 Tax=Kwoniella dejecticola CBS 10117 TaxID=1296121 RepID=A0A1A5ZTV7_9TREE|nr:uncharacterized protein I303_08629 [Kwoniella dejecticola CBS 10117]OBR81244.1 hypothetical protein I303_08629 [Kwoniella dejecticola CBS 10117]